MRLHVFAAVFSAALLVPGIACGQLPPGYWNYYDSSSKSPHRHHTASGAQQHATSHVAHEPWVDRRPAADPMNYEGRGMTGQGVSAYQGNGYSGGNQGLYYGYWDGGFQPGNLYGYSMYPHFNRPGFTYWQQ
jgi:hypothetical protein